jgi:riboflavin kinase/FMN adenylyltransferase
MMNIGHRPTVSANQAQKLSIEIHIFDFQNDIYGHYLQVELLQFIRDEIKFETNAQLSEQIHKDELYCRSSSRLFSLQPFTL